MATKKTNVFDYTQKSTELETVLQRLQDPDIAIDEASSLYDIGLKLADELESYLKQAENTVRVRTAG